MSVLDVHELSKLYDAHGILSRNQVTQNVTDAMYYLELAIEYLETLPKEGFGNEA